MPLPRSGRDCRHNSRRRRSHESGEERSGSSRQQEDEEQEANPASAKTTVQDPLSAFRPKRVLSEFKSKPVAPPWQPSGRCLTLSLGSRVWEWFRLDWGRTFCIRLDLQGCFHTYPDVGGPFQNLQQADTAIHRYLEDRRDPKIKVANLHSGFSCMEEGAEFSTERIVRRSLYWPDGTIKKRTRSYVAKQSHKRVCQIIQALVDKYNEDHNLLKHEAHKLKDILHYQLIWENQSWYYHLNFTTDKGASTDNLIFAEVKCMPQGQHEELLVCCFCTVNPNDNGQHCKGCTNNGKVDMKHPGNSVEYIAGHLDVSSPFGSFGELSDSEDDDVKYVKAREAKLRRTYKRLHEPGVLKRLFTLPPGVTIVGD